MSDNAFHLGALAIVLGFSLVAALMVRGEAFAHGATSRSLAERTAERNQAYRAIQSITAQGCIVQPMPRASQERRT